MTLQWSFIAYFLYSEIAAIIVLLLPFISPARWQKVFRSNLVAKVAQFSNIYFNVFILILLVLFGDAIREERKYSEPTSVVDLKHNPDTENIAHMKMFRAQRNLYISGFALFLWFVIRRLVTLISTQAQLQAQAEASTKQAKGASDQAKKLMEEIENMKNMAKLEDTDLDAVKREKDLAHNLDDVQQELKKLKKELQSKELDFNTLKKQSEGTNKEYDRLLNELAVTQAKLEASEGGDKKSN